MKRRMVLLPVLLVLVWNIVQGKLHTYELTFSESDFRIETNEGNLEIHPLFPESGYPDPETPEIPFRSFNITVEGGIKSVSSPLFKGQRLLMTQVTVAPTQYPAPTDGSIPPQRVTSTNYPQSIYPSSNCILTSTSTWGNRTVLHFLISPFVYYPKEKKLYFIDKVELSVESTDNAGVKPLGFVGKELIKNISFNKDELFIRPEELNPGSGRTPLDYVIITNEALRLHFETLCNWKRSKGLYSEIYTVESIDATYSGNDLPLKIKTFLNELFTYRSLKYVLLGGDDTVVPVRGCYCRVSTFRESKIDPIIPSDIYYACFSGEFDWNRNKNGVYGELDDGIEFAQSLLISRLPVQTPDDVANYTEKLLCYEQDPKWTNSLLMGGTKLWENHVTGRSDAEVQGEKLYNDYIAPYWNGIRKKFYDTNTDFSQGSSYDFTAANLADVVLVGSRISKRVPYGMVEFNGNPVKISGKHILLAPEVSLNKNVELSTNL